MNRIVLGALAKLGAPPAASPPSALAEAAYDTRGLAGSGAEAVRIV
jgi:hypothetical protein